VTALNTLLGKASRGVTQKELTQARSGKGKTSILWKKGKNDSRQGCLLEPYNAKEKKAGSHAKGDR